MICTKLALMCWIAFTCIQANMPMAQPVFLLLLYFCVNIAMYIWKITALPAAFSALSIFISISGYVYVHPLFAILAPLSILVLLQVWIQSKWISAAILLAPAFSIKSDIAGQYVFAAAASWIIWDLACTYTGQMEKKEKQLDWARASIQKLTRSLNENREFIRQSEYTYRLEERNRISQEIHDDIGHAMTGALIQMEAAKRLMEKDARQAQNLLQNAINITKEGIESIRLTLKSLKPSTEQVGIHRLQLALGEFSAGNNIETIITHHGNLDIITPVQWKIIHENVKEALTNARKYADATQITVDIQVLNKMVRAEVRDNGKGAVKIKKGLGISGMEERAASLEGHVITDGSHGFSVTTLLPIQS